MRPERDWISIAVWLVLLGFAFIAGLVVVGQAFAAHIPTVDSYTLRVSADYSAEPRALRLVAIPQIDRAVIGDTVRDIIVEQRPVPVIGLELVATATPTSTLRQTRTPTPKPAGTPRVTPSAVNGATQVPTAQAATPMPAISTLLAATASPSDRPGQDGRPPRTTATPRISSPTSTARPTSTPRPTNSPTPRPANTARPTAPATIAPPTPTYSPLPTASDTPEPTASDTPAPTATATPEPTATNTPEPAATDTPEPAATDTPEPAATATPELPAGLPTDVAETNSDLPSPTQKPDVLARGP